MRGGFDFLQVRGPSTWHRMPRLPAMSLAAAGSTQADGVAIPFTGLITVTGADATKGAVLPAPSGKGDWCVVKNDDAANAVLKVYPATGGKINNGSANAALSMAAKTSAFFFSPDGTNWVTLPLLPS